MGRILQDSFADGILFFLCRLTPLSFKSKCVRKNIFKKGGNKKADATFLLLLFFALLHFLKIVKKKFD